MVSSDTILPNCLFASISILVASSLLTPCCNNCWSVPNGLERSMLGAVVVPVLEPEPGLFGTSVFGTSVFGISVFGVTGP